MRKRVYGRRLSRDTNERKALFRSLATSLVRYGRIDTTEAKAKAVRPWVEKLVTKSKTNDLNSRRNLLEEIPNPLIIDKLLGSIGPLFAKRPGGYTRLIRLGNRIGDNAPMVRIEFVEEIKEVATTPKKTKTVAPKAPAKKSSSPKRASAKKVTTK